MMQHSPSTGILDRRSTELAPSRYGRNIGSRWRAVVFLDANFLPLPDDEAVAHALFEVAVGREVVPPDRQALCTLIKKYTVHGSQGDA